MVKNKLVKNIAIDELAVIINKGFDGQMAYMEKKFEQVSTKEQVRDLEKRFEKVEKDLGAVKTILTDAHVL